MTAAVLADDLRDLVELDPLVTISIEPDVLDVVGRPVRVIRTSGGFDLAVPGDRFHGGVYIYRSGETIPNQHTCRTSEWRAMLARDPELQAHVDAGHLRVETVAVDAVVADALSGGCLSRPYR